MSKMSVKSKANRNSNRKVVKRTIQKKAPSATSREKQPKALARKGKYVVFSSTLKPRHLTEKQIERAVKEVIAARKLKELARKK